MSFNCSCFIILQNNIYLIITGGKLLCHKFVLNCRSNARVWCFPWWSHDLEMVSTLMNLFMGPPFRSPVVSRHKETPWHCDVTVIFTMHAHNQLTKRKLCNHNDVFKWKHFPRYWPFVRGIHRSPVNSPHKKQWRGVLMFSLICVWINGWVNNHRDVTVMGMWCVTTLYVIVKMRFQSIK